MDYITKLFWLWSFKDKLRRASIRAFADFGSNSKALLGAHCWVAVHRNRPNVPNVKVFGIKVLVVECEVLLSKHTSCNASVI